MVNNIELFKSVVSLQPSNAWFRAKYNIINKIIQIHAHSARISPYGS